MKQISWFAENHVAANLLMMFLVLAGIFTLSTIKLEVFPETSMDKISIITSYPGASPAEVEEAIVRRIEEHLAGLSGIKRIDSTSKEGIGTVTVEIIKGWNIKTLLDEVKAEVDRITTFPDEAEKPIVKEVVQRIQVISVGIYGDAAESTIKYLAEKAKDEITSLPGVTSADILGVRDGEIHIEISEETLRRYGLTLGQVAETVRLASLDLPAGSVKTKGGEILIRTKGRLYYADEFSDISVITRTDGSRVTLGQIASLSDGFEDVDLFARFQSKPAAMIQVYRVADQSAFSVAKAVKQYIVDAKPLLPEGIDIAFFADMSEILLSRLHLLLRNMAIGLILVILILGAFLNIRLSFWVTLGIPISFLAGLATLPYLDVTINMISLFAFIMVLGIVVDDAIIVGENIYQKQEAGLPPLEAATQGATEVGHPVIFSVLTTMVAFAPLLTGSGMMGKMLRNIPIVIMVVLLGSLIESLFILPAHLSRSKSAGSEHNPGLNNEKRTARWMRAFTNGPYLKAVKFCVRWRYATVALGIALLLITVGIIRGGIVGFTFFPKVESDTMECSLTMPAGTPLERTVEVTRYLEEIARETLADADKEHPGSPSLFQYSFALIGAQVGDRGGLSDTGGHLAYIWIQVLEGEKRKESTARLAALWRKNVGAITDIESMTFKSVLHSAGKSVEIHLSLDDNDNLLAAADKLEDELRSYPGVHDVSDSFLPGKNEVQIKLKPAARSLGLNLNDIARQVRHAFYGAEALRMQRGKDEVKVLVRYPEQERKSLEYVERMRIRTADGREIPLNALVDITMNRGFSSIEHTRRQRVIKIYADVDEAVTNANEVRQTLEEGFLQELKNLHPGLRYAMEGEGREQKESLDDIKTGFLFALFCIYALLAIPFRSFTQPFVVMAAIPFGIVGAVAGHLVMGLDITFLSLFGMVGLAGIVVNDSLVLIHATNRLRKEGANARNAVVQAGTLRFRAIILTSLTTFAGLTPMILEKSLQAKFLIPMAVSLGYGVLYATFITLLFVPCIYLILEDILNLTARRSNEGT
ncbi:MAG: efflux RND transporter permease subunit [Thermodesulfobacteriota bacterium]|nr:efflux RND transporter permease subunit [Thermodesulfobacteriota bacterium]